jgi:hypothetical protein
MVYMINGYWEDVLVFIAQHCDSELRAHGRLSAWSQLHTSHFLLPNLEIKLPIQVRLQPQYALDADENSTFIT